MNANMPLDPTTAAAIQHLPSAWQGYVTSAILLLMILGRLVASNTGAIGAIKSIFIGSVHGTSTPVTAPLPASPPVPVATSTTVTTTKPV